MHEEPPPPLSPEDTLRVLLAVAGTQSMLVGGQAVAWWVTVYGDRLPELGDREHMFVSQDVDFLGSRHDATVCASGLGGRVRIPDAMTLVSPAVNTAVVAWRDSDGREREVDFLGVVYGVKSRDARTLAVPFDVAGSTLYVLHPVLTLISRFANCVGLPGYADELHVEQARVSVLTAREWLIDHAETDPRAALKEVERLFRFATTRTATSAWQKFELEAFHAIQPIEHLPMRFRTTRYPQMQKIIRAARRPKAQSE